MNARKLIPPLVVFLALGSIVLITTLIPSRNTTPSEVEARAIAEAVLQQVVGSHAGLLTESETNAAMTLHVDVSSSMVGYAPFDEKTPDTTFVKVIEYLSTQWNPRARLRAISSHYSGPKGYPNDHRFFRDQRSYRGTHDMAATIHSFAQDRGRMHVLVTDNQPWDEGNNPAYEKVAAAINDFLSTGGRCALLLYRSAYKGAYSSPMLPQHKQVDYDCPNRPFAVWVFAHRGCALNSLLAELSEKKDSLQCQRPIQFGEPKLQLALADHTRPEDNPAKKVGREIGKLTPMKTGNQASRIKDYEQIRIRKVAIDSAGYVPLQLDISEANISGSQSLRNLQKARRVTIDVWEIPGKLSFDAEGNFVSRDPASASTNGVATTNAPSRKGLELKRVFHGDVDHTLYIQTNAPSSNALSTAHTNTPGARLVVPLLRDPSIRRAAVLITLKPKFSGTSIELPEGFSTPDDRSSDQCSKILKLDEMLGIVAGSTEKLGMLLFLIEYPK